MLDLAVHVHVAVAVVALRVSDQARIVLVFVVVQFSFSPPTPPFANSGQDLPNNSCPSSQSLLPRALQQPARDSQSDEVGQEVRLAGLRGHPAGIEDIGLLRRKGQ